MPEQNGCCTVENRDVYIVDPWDLAKTPLHQLCGWLLPAYTGSMGPTLPKYTWVKGYIVEPVIESELKM